MARIFALNACLLASATCFSYVVGQESKESGTQLEVLAPERMEISFGDPVFLPLGIMNASPEATIGPNLSIRTADMIVRATSGDVERLIPYDPFYLGHRTEFAPYTMQSTMLLVNIWSKPISKAFLESGTATLSVEFGTQAERIVLPPKKVQLILKGSSFTEEGHRSMVLLCNQGLDLPEKRIGPPSLVPFVVDTTPLSWSRDSSGTPKERNRELYDSKSQLNSEAKAMVRPDTKLARIVEFNALLAPLLIGRYPQAQVQWPDQFDKIRQLLTDCDPDESQYYLQELSVDLYFRDVVIPWADREKIKLELRNQFPTFASLFTGRGTYVLEALLPEAKASKPR